DKLENAGAQLVKSVASKTNDIAGDGTTTSTVLARVIFEEGSRAVGMGFNPVQVKRGIDEAVESVVSYLEERARPVTAGDVLSVAALSANGDYKIGGLIAEAMDEVGLDGVISIAEGKTVTDSLEVVEGVRFDRGWLSPYFISDPRAQTVVLENPMVLLVNRKVSNVQQLLTFLESALSQSRPLLIVAEDVEGEALTTLIVNRLRSSLDVCAVKAPGFGESRRDMLEDLGVITGSTVVSDDSGERLETLPETILGSCKRATISKDNTVLLSGAGDRAAVEERVSMLKDQLRGELSTYQREKLEERVARMSAGVAVIKVGGVSEVEAGEKRD
ncbi:chaperonin Cpn60, partial [Kipferlia bialata]